MMTSKKCRVVLRKLFCHKYHFSLNNQQRCFLYFKGVRTHFPAVEMNDGTSTDDSSTCAFSSSSLTPASSPFTDYDCDCNSVESSIAAKQQRFPHMSECSLSSSSIDILGLDDDLAECLDWFASDAIGKVRCDFFEGTLCDDLSPAPF